MGPNEILNSFSGSVRFSLEQEMRAIKFGHDHLRFDPIKLFKTRGIDEAILLRLDIQDRRSDVAQLHANITSEHHTETRGQHLRVH
jgi:hypothetical protein